MRINILAMPSLALFVFINALSFPAFSQDFDGLDVIVMGTLISRSGDPVKFYPVTIEGTTVRKKEFSVSVTTNDKGVFEMPEVPAGNYTIWAANSKKSGKDVEVPFVWYWRPRMTIDIGQVYSEYVK